jgi:ureidoglycolate hydrolase
MKDPIEIFDFPAEGYEPIVDYQHWRVAVLKYCEELEISQLMTMQKHDQTDEVFVLLAGHCILFSAGDNDIPMAVQAIDMKPQKIYNVKRGVWHTHTLDQQAALLIVENRNTSAVNSPTMNLTKEQISEMQVRFEAAVQKRGKTYGEL